MKSNLYTIFYAAVLGIVCALLLTAAEQFTKGYAEANARAEETRNVLTALKVPYDEKATADQLIEIFNQNIETRDIASMEAYVYSDQGQVKSVAIPFEGPGVWGPIKGYLALEKDMTTIRAVAFYQQEETPGLGGEIAGEKFLSGFEGQKIVDENSDPGIVIAIGASTKSNGIDAIAGATMTCDKVQEMINKTITSLAEDNK